MPLGREVDLSPGDNVLDEDPAPPKGRGTALPQFSAHVCCRQMAGWIKMTLGTKVGLGRGHIVLDEDPATLKRGTTPNFQSVSIVAKRSPISATAEHLLWPPYKIGQAIIFLPFGFFPSFFFFLA